MRRQDPVARLPALALVVGTGALGAYLAARAGGPLAGGLAAAAAACGAGLLLAIDPRSRDSAIARDAFDGVVFALPGALVVYFSFSAGGYLPGAPAFAAIALALLLVLRVTLVDAPFAGFSMPLALAMVALSLYALWTLLSAGWSDSPARALIEFDRVLVYLLALLLFGSIPRTAARLRWIVRGLAVGLIAVAVAALATRAFPDVFSTAVNPVANARLDFPVGYSNALGLLCMIGAVLCLHIAASLHEPIAMRALASAAMPVLGATALLTQSRGAIAAGLIGVTAYVALGRPRGLLPALVATGPPTIIALLTAADAELLRMRDFPGVGAAEQGHDLASTVALCSVVAAALRLLLWRVDARLRRPVLPRRLVPVAQFASVAAVAVALAVAVVGGAPGWLSEKFDGFLYGSTTEASGGGAGTTRDNSAATGGRVDYWRVGLQGFREQRLQGQGAGSYEYSWSRERPAAFAGDPVTDAHSLYVETLHDLGLVGLLLVAAALLAILASLVPIGRRRDRSLYAALFATGLIWALHAAVDWDWELPAVTVWLFAVGGVALAGKGRADTGIRLSQGSRVVIGLALLLATVGPGLVLVSQRQLDESVDAYKRGDCPEAIERASASISTLEGRAEPYEVLAYCQARRGNARLALRAMEEAVEREPANAKFRFGLALVRGAAGLDPRPAARAARRLNPQDIPTKELLGQLDKATPDGRRRLSTALARTQPNLAVVR